MQPEYVSGSLRNLYGTEHTQINICGGTGMTILFWIGIWVLLSIPLAMLVGNIIKFGGAAGNEP